jgi:glucoamylase
VHVVDLPTLHLSRDDRVDFTFYWPDADRWEGIDYQVCIE